MSPTPEQQKRMEETTRIIIGTIAVAALIFIVIWSLPDWGWIADRFQEHIVRFGGYGNEY